MTWRLVQLFVSRLWKFKMISNIIISLNTPKQCEERFLRWRILENLGTPAIGATPLMVWVMTSVFFKFGNITAIINIAISIHFFCLTKVHLLLFPWWTEDLFWSKQVSRTHLLLLGWRGNLQGFCWTFQILAIYTVFLILGLNNCSHLISVKLSESSLNFRWFGIE